VANQIALAVENAIAYGEIASLKDKLAQEVIYLQDEIRTELKFEEIVGNSDVLRRLLAQIETVAPTDSTVLIYGETGTGKELIARAIHNLSSRTSNAFVKLNCAAIPTGLLKANCSATKKAHSPAQSRSVLADSSSRIEAPCFSMRLAKSPRTATEAAAGFTGARIRAPGQHTYAPHRRPVDRRDQSQSGGDGGRAEVSHRPLLPLERFPRPGSRIARTRMTFLCWSATLSSSSAGA